MSETAAWYLGIGADAVGEAAILVGDPARIPRLATHLHDARIVSERRGLRTVTGLHRGRRITASAFGMGAPIATIVLHELFALGVRAFLRIGTAMAMPPAALGSFVLADGALRAEGTSATYAPAGFPAVADFDLNARLRHRLAAGTRPWHAGIFASYDGFYTEMFALDADGRGPIERVRTEMERLRLIAVDMETAALLTAGRVLGARASSLCLATVDAASQAKLDAAALAEAERALFAVALDALADDAERHA
jgi:uridine phosphorylase